MQIIADLLNSRVYSCIKIIVATEFHQTKVISITTVVLFYFQYTCKMSDYGE